LDDHVVDTVNVELDLGSGITVAQTELRNSRRLGSETFDQVGEMHPDAADDFWNGSRVLAGHAQAFCDRSPELGFDDAQHVVLSLFILGQVGFEEEMKVFR